MAAFKAFVAPRKGDYVQRSDDTTVITLHALSFRGDKSLTGHVQSSTFLTDDSEVRHGRLMRLALIAGCASYHTRMLRVRLAAIAAARHVALHPRLFGWLLSAGYPALVSAWLLRITGHAQFTQKGTGQLSLQLEVRNYVCTHLLSPELCVCAAADHRARAVHAEGHRPAEPAAGDARVPAAGPAGAAALRLTPVWQALPEGWPGGVLGRRAC